MMSFPMLKSTEVCVFKGRLATVIAELAFAPMADGGDVSTNRAVAVVTGWVTAGHEVSYTHK